MFDVTYSNIKFYILKWLSFGFLKPLLPTIIIDGKLFVKFSIWIKAGIQQLIT